MSYLEAKGNYSLHFVITIRKRTLANGSGGANFLDCRIRRLTLVRAFLN